MAKHSSLPFTTIGATMNYWAKCHVDEILDEIDANYEVVAWFDDNLTNDFMLEDIVLFV